MLVLKRRLGERVFLDLPSGGKIEVMVIESFRGGVRLGFAAPQDVRIYRDNFEQKGATNASDSGTAAGGNGAANSAGCGGQAGSDTPQDRPID